MGTKTSVIQEHALGKPKSDGLAIAGILTHAALLELCHVWQSGAVRTGILLGMLAVGQCLIWCAIWLIWHSRSTTPNAYLRLIAAVVFAILSGWIVVTRIIG